MRNGSVSALAAMLFATMGSFGSEISAETAESTAGAFLQRSAMARRILPDRTVIGSERWGSLWIVNLSPSGHVIISGSDKCAPVWQFSANDFTEPDEDSALLDILTEASNRCAEADADPSLSVSPEWATYASTSSSTSTTSRRTKAGAANASDCSPFVAPLLNAAWHQGSPYSDFSPLTVVCGCMATAAGQEHRYWRWPYYIPKFRALEHNVKNEPKQTIRYNGFVPFDYDLIYGSYDGGDTPSKTGNDSHGNNAKKARFEAAYLTGWMQSMVGMSFAPGASGGTRKLCNDANDIYFERGDVQNKSRNGYDTLWTSITNDLEFGSPIQVNTPGHQMVIDGYGIEAVDGTQKDWININYGWGYSESWIDMRTQYDSSSLADFQVGYRPRKMVQIEPIAKKASGSVDLTFHLPFCYTNNISAIRTDIYTVSDSVESIVAYDILPVDAASNTSTVFTRTVNISSYGTGTNLRFYAYPVMSDGSESVMSDPVDTTVGTPAASPTISGVSVVANGIELLQDGFFAECGIGITNEIKVTCANATGLAAYPSRVSMLPDEKVGIVTNASVFTVKLDASEMLSDWDGDMMLLTLAANNVDGTTVYKNLVLRFSNVRKVVNGTYQVVENVAATEPLDFCGTDCELDANGHTLEITSGVFTGTGSVVLENTGSGGGFVFNTLNDFSGTLSLVDGVAVTLPENTSGYSGTLNTVSGTVPILGNLPATATINIASGATNVLNNVSVLATVKGSGTVCVTNGTNRLGNSSTFGGNIVVSGSGTELTMNAGDQRNVIVGADSTLYLELSEELYNLGYMNTTVSFVTVEEGGTVYFKYGSDTYVPTDAGDGLLMFEPRANVWTATGTNDRYSEIYHWSLRRLPAAGEYAVLKIDDEDTPWQRSIELDLSADITLKGLKVASIAGGAGMLTINQSGDHTLTAQKFTNDTLVNLNTTQILADAMEPGMRVLLHSDKPVAYTIDYSYENYFRMYDNPNNYHAVTNAAAWHGTVVFTGYNTDVSNGAYALNPNVYGNANSVVRFNGVVGRLYYNTDDAGATYLPTIDLVDLGSSPALLWHNGSHTVAEVFQKLTGDGTFRTRSPANGGWEKVLIKDVSDFRGDFDLEAKTVGLGGNAVPSTDTSNSGRLHICAAITNYTGSVWRAADNVFIAGDATLSVKGVIDTQTIVSYGPNATLNLLDGGEIRVLSGSASSDVDTFAQNFYAGTFKLKDSITQEVPINFCATNGTWTTVDVDGQTLTFGPDAMTGSGDIYFTSSDTVNRGKVVIKSLDLYSGTIHIGENVDIEFPENSSHSECTVLVGSGRTFSVKAGTECNIVVESGATLYVVLSAEQILYGYDASENVNVREGGTVAFVNRSGSAVLSGSGTDTVYEPLPGVTTGLSATAIWMSGDFDHPTTNGYSIALNSNIISNRNIFIESGNLKGVTIDLPASTYTKASVIVRFRIPSGGAPSDNTAIAGVISTDSFPISAISPTAGGSALQGAYLNKNNGYALNTGSWNFTEGDAPTADAGHGYMLFAYQSDDYGSATHGTAVYLGTSLESLYGGNKGGLQWGGKTLNTIAIGGPVDDKDKTHVWAGLEIDGIALFADQWLTAETAQDFAFPHTELNILAGETLSVTAGSPRSYESIGTLSATGTIRIDNIAELGEGTYEIAKWREVKLPSAYGSVGTLAVEGMDEDYGAELVYDTTSISLRVFKAIYSVTLSDGTSTFSNELFDPDLPSDYSRKTLEVNVTENSTLTIPDGGVTVKEIDFNVESGKTLTLSGGTISADVIGINGTISGTLDLSSVAAIRLPADVTSPVTLATTVTGTISQLIIGDSVYSGEYTLDGNVLTIKRYKAISINFGSNQNGGNAAVGRSAYAGLASVRKWMDTMEYGVNGTYPTVGRSSLTLSDSEGTSYPEMALYINSRGGNYYGKGDTSTETSKLLYGFLDDFENSTVNAGVKVTGVNAFAAKYAAYVYFNADAAVDSTNYFPPYYINGVMYRGNGSATVPGRERWGTVKSDSLADGVNALVVHGLTNDTLVVAQPHNMGGRGCIAAIQIVEESADDHTTDFVTPSGMSAVTVVPPSDDWSDRTLPSIACTTNVTGSYVSFGSTTPTDYYQLLGNRESIVALITGTDETLYEAAGMQTKAENKSCGNRDIYLLISGGSFTNVMGYMTKGYNLAAGSQSGGNDMVQIGGNATVQYAYGAGREGWGGTAPGSVGLTIMDNAILTGSAFGGWSSYHQETPAVTGNTSVKVLNVQSVNSAPTELALVNNAIVGGSVFGTNAGSTSATIGGSSSVIVDVSGVVATTNFVKRLIGGSAGFNTYSGHGGTYAVEGDSSVTVTAPNNVTFTGDITGGGFIQNNTGMYATVGGNSSVTLNGGTYSGITITAGARGDGTDKATVAGDATLTINGGVFTGATLAAGSANGKKTLVLGSGASVADATITGFTTFVLPADTMFPYQLASSVTVPDGVDPVLVIGDEVYDSEWSIISGGITLGGLARTAAFTGGESPVAFESLSWNVSIHSDNILNATNTVNVTASGKIALGTVTTAKVVFNVAEDAELTLTGTISATEIHITGLGSVICSAADTLQGTIKGDGTVVYTTNIKPPTTSGWTNETWTGTLVFINCTTGGYVPFQSYGNTNSIVKAPGFVGYTTADTTAHCFATLVIDSDTTFTLNNGNSSSGFRFAKLSGEGNLVLTGHTTATTQYVFEDVSDFHGSVTVDPDNNGVDWNDKSLVLGAPTTWAINATSCNAYKGKLVVAGNVALSSGKTWSASKGVELIASGVLAFEGTGTISGPVNVAAGATIDLTASTASTPISGTLTVASGSTIKIPEDASYPYVLATDAVVSGETLPTLYISDYPYPLWTIANGAIYPGGLSRSATLRGGNNNWSECWAIPFEDESLLTNTINVTANSTLTLGTVNTAKVVFNVAEGVQLILMSGSVTASEIQVTGLGEVICYAGNNMLNGTFTGDGTVVYYGATPPEGAGWIENTWTGTVWLMNVTSGPALPVNKWCNEGSKVKFTSVKGYLPGKNSGGNWELGYDGSLLGELILEDDGVNPAFVRSDGYSHYANVNSYCKFSKLSGTGTFTDSKSQNIYVVFTNASEFAGSLYFTNNTTIVIGDSSPAGTTDYDGKIVVEAGKSATIATGKTWRATNSGLLVKGNMAFAGTGAFEGNATSESGSVLDFSGSTSAKPVTGTLTIANGTTIKLPSAAEFPYTLANAITISDPCSVTLQIGERVYSSTALEVSGGAICCTGSTATFAGSASAVSWGDLVWDVKYHVENPDAELTVNATGSGTINVGTLSAETLNFSVAENQELTLTGSIEATTVALSGAGRIVLNTALDVDSLSKSGTVSVVLDTQGLESGLSAGGRVMLFSGVEASFFDDIILPASTSSLYFVLQTTSEGTYLVAIPTWADTVNINFTHNSASLTTSDPVGLVGVPGTQWNNVTGVATTGSYTNSKVVSEDGTQSVAIPGLDVSYSGTRGSYRANNLTASSDLLHGYLDDNNNASDANSNPRVAITGIPFKKYRVIVYHSIDTANIRFGYDTVNSVNYYYDSSKVRQTGTTAWGATGVADNAESIEEGVNTLVSGVQTESPLIVTAHCTAASSARSGLAAIQVVRVDEATIAEAGTYTLAGLFGGVSAKSDFYVNVTESATLNIPSATTIGAIEFNVASGKTLTLSGADLTATVGGFTVSGGGSVLVDAGGTSVANPRRKVVDGKIYGGAAIGVTSSAGGISVDVIASEGVYLCTSSLSATFAMGSNSYLTGTYVTTTAQAAFGGITLQQFYDGGYALKGRLAGGNVNKLGVEASGYNPYVTDDGAGNVTSIRYEMQAINAGWIKCVVITLTPDAGGTGINAVANGACYTEESNGLGFALLNDDGTSKDGVTGANLGTAYNSSESYSLYGLNIVGKNPESVSVSGDTTLTVGTDLASAYSTLTVTGSGTLTVVGNLNVDTLAIGSGTTVKLAENFGARTISAASGATVAYVGGEGSSFDWATISGVGAVEIRSGIVRLWQDNSGLTGGITVKSGAKLKSGNEKAFGPQSTETWVIVEDGGTVDMAGQPTLASYRIAGDGEGDGALVNTGDEIGNTKAQTRTIELTADASIGGLGHFGMIRNGNDAVKLKFPADGATLTKNGTNTFWMCNVTRDTSGGYGTIQVDAGVLYIRENAVTLNGVTLNFNGGSLDGNKALTVDHINIASGTPCNSFGQTLTATNVTVNAGGFARNAATSVTTLNVADGATANVNAYNKPSTVNVASGGSVMFENYNTSSAIDYTAKTISGAGTIKFQGGATAKPVTIATATVSDFTGDIEMGGNGNLLVNTEGYDAGIDGAVFSGNVYVAGTSAITASSGTMPLNVVSIESVATMTVSNVNVSVGTNRPAGTLSFADGEWLGTSALSAEFVGQADIVLNVSGALTAANVTAYKPGGTVEETGATKTIADGVLTIRLAQITIPAETTYTTYDALSVPESGNVAINTDHPVTVAISSSDFTSLTNRSDKIYLNTTEDGAYTLSFVQNVAGALSELPFEGGYVVLFDVGTYSAESLATPMTVPSNTLFVFTNSTDAVVEYPSVLTVPATGAVKTVADLNFSAANSFASGATLEVAAGTAQFNFAENGAPETVAIATDATLAVSSTTLTAVNGITVLGEGTLRIMNDLSVTGNITMSDSATLAFDDDASLSVTGNFTVRSGETLAIAPPTIAGASVTLISATSVTGEFALVPPDDDSDYLLVKTDTAVILKRAPKTAAFTYDPYPGANAPTGWITGWGGEGFSTTSFRVGPNSSTNWVYHTASGKHPWCNISKKTTAFTYAIYADVSHMETAKGVVSAFGTTGNGLVLYREKTSDLDDYVKLARVSSGSITTPSWVPGVAVLPGFHLYTFTFDPETGAAALYLDDGSTCAVTDGDTKPHLGTGDLANGFQLGSIYQGVGNSGFKVGVDMAVCAVRGYDTALDAGSVAVLASKFPATDGNVNWTIAPENAGNTYIVPSRTLGDSNYLGITRGTLTIPSNSTVNVKHLRVLNLGYDTDSTTVNIDGTVNVTSTSSDPDVWYERNQNKGILFGHWSGTATYNITGRLIGENAYLQTVYTAGTQTININGGTVSVKGVWAYKNTSSINITNGGTLEVAEIPGKGTVYGGGKQDTAAIAMNFGYGTYRQKATGEVTHTMTFSGTETEPTTLDPYGCTMTVASTAGTGYVTVNDTVGGGKVIFKSSGGKVVITDANAANIDISDYTGTVIYSGSTAGVAVLDGFAGTVYFTSNVDVSEIDLSGANINIADNIDVTATATKEGVWPLVIGSGATLTLKVSDSIRGYDGYFPTVSGSGTVTYLKADGTAVDSEQIVGNNLMPYYNVWIPSADGNNNTISADAAARWRLGSLPASGKNVAFKLDGDATVTIDATVSYNDVQVYGSGVLTIVQSGDNVLTVANGLYGTAGVGIKVESGLTLGAAARLEVEGQMTVNSTLTVSTSGGVGTLAVDRSGIVNVGADVTLAAPTLAVTGVVNMASSTSAFSGLTRVAGVGTVNWNGKAPDTELWNSQATWRGTNSVANLTENVERKPQKWGYGDTYVRLSNVKGWLANSTTINPEVILDNGDGDFGLEISDGSSNDNVTIFRKLSGDGTLKGTGTGGNQRYIFRDVTNFTGSIVKTDTVRVFVISASSTTYPARDTYKGYIYVASDGYAKIGAGKEWSVSTGGIEINGTVELMGAASMTPSSSGAVVLNGGAKIKLANAPLTVNGTLTLPTSGNMTIDPGNIDMSGESAVLIAGVTPSEALADGTMLRTINVDGYPAVIVAAKENGDKIDIVAYNELPVASEGTDVIVPTTWAINNAASAITAQNPSTVLDMENLLATARGANGCTYLESYALGLTPEQPSSQPTADMSVSGDNIELFFKNLEVPDGVVLTVTAVKDTPGGEEEVLSEASVTVTRESPNRVILPIPDGRVQLYRLKVSISGPAAD